MRFGRKIHIPVALELFLSLAPLWQPQHYTHFTYDSIVVRVSPITTKFYRGMMAFTFIPGPITKSAWTPTQLSSLPTSLLDASSTDAMEITIPYPHPVSKCVYADLAENFGNLCVWVMDPLAADSAPSITTSTSLQIEARFVNPQLHDPTPITQTIPAPVARTIKAPALGGFWLTQGPKTVSKESQEKSERGIISDTLNSISSIASSASVLPVVGGFASGLSVVSGAAASVFDWFGLSKPLNQSTPLYVNTGALPFRNTTSGVTNADPMSADILPYVSTDPHLLNSEIDECNIDTIAMTPSLIDRFEINNTLDKNHIGRIAVQPSYAWVLGKTYTPSNLAYAANFYKQWRGDIAFKMIIPASSMTRARLAITYNQQPLTEFSELARFMYVDIVGTTVIDGVIPWMQQFPYKDIQNPRGPGGAATNGHLQFWLITPLTSDTPGVDPLPLSLLVFAAATTNTQFAGLSTMSDYFTNATPAGFLGLDKSIKISRFLPEDNIHSIREILHRPSQTAIATVTSPTLFSVNIADTLRADPLLRYVFNKFRFYRGSVTVNLYFKAKAPPTLMVYDSNALIPANSRVWVPEREPICSVLLPFRHARCYHGTDAVYNLDENRRLTITHDNPDTTPYVLLFDISFNDDLSFGRNVGPPPMSLP